MSNLLTAMYKSLANGTPLPQLDDDVFHAIGFKETSKCKAHYNDTVEDIDDTADLRSLLGGGSWSS